MAKSKSGILINEYRPVSRADYGVRVAKNGFDANAAADSELLFNSNWPIMQIVKVISESDKIIEIDETRNVPSSWTFIKIEIESTFIWSCYVDEKWVYLPIENHWYLNTNTYEIEILHKQYKVYHGLGYVPMFFHSEYISDKPGYFVLTNIDLRKDVDYPYTTQPSNYDGGTSDYGIKSKSFAREDMPASNATRGCGINTAIQAKMVMAVKTEVTKTASISGQEAAVVSWSVPQDNNSLTTDLFDYEPFVYISYDGVTPMKEAAAGNFPRDDRYGSYRIIGQSAFAPESKASLVILRSPMVAPDVEEFTIS